MARLPAASQEQASIDNFLRTRTARIFEHHGLYQSIFYDSPFSMAKVCTLHLKHRKLHGVNIYLKVFGHKCPC
jgi:hypothetical protein